MAKLSAHAIKPLVRDLLPVRYQVPVKYWYSWIRGSLEKEMAILGQLLGGRGRVIDVGGNRGIYAYRCWKLGARVEVFEPNPTCLRVLNAWAAGKPRVSVYPVALSNHSGTADLHIPVDESGVEHDASASIEHSGFAHARDQSVELKTLDSYGFNSVDLIKIDVEGHEDSVIDGALVTLASSMPTMLVEIEQRHSGRPVIEVFDKILRLGYLGFFMGINGLTPIEHFDPSRDQSMEKFGGVKGHYINNFVFLHQRRLANGEYGPLMGRSKQ
ncbi:MAG: FkbM family methyltransferase [Gammaproteobacteria bacterium]